MNIHSTAIIENGAKIGKNVVVGPYSIVRANVELGDNVKLLSHVVVSGYTTIGENTIIHPFASIGGNPQDLKYNNEPTKLIIGKNNVIREHVTMNPGTVSGERKTVVGDNCLFMMGAHVAHDCKIGNNVIMANNATLAGHVSVGDFVIIGGLSAVHQFIRIGNHAIIGGMSGVESEVIPFGRVKGERADLAGLNIIGMERRSFDRNQIRSVQKAFNKIFSSEGNLKDRINKAYEEFKDDEIVKQILDFASVDTGFPLCQPKKKK